MILVTGCSSSSSSSSGRDRFEAVDLSSTGFTGAALIVVVSEECVLSFGFLFVLLDRSIHTRKREETLVRGAGQLPSCWLGGPGGSRSAGVCGVIGLDVCSGLLTVSGGQAHMDVSSAKPSGAVGIEAGLPVGFMSETQRRRQGTSTLRSWRGGGEGSVRRGDGERGCQKL